MLKSEVVLCSILSDDDTFNVQGGEVFGSHMTIQMKSIEGEDCSFILWIDKLLSQEAGGRTLADSDLVGWSASGQVVRRQPNGVARWQAGLEEAMRLYDGNSPVQ